MELEGVDSSVRQSLYPLLVIDCRPRLINRKEGDGQSEARHLPSFPLVVVCQEIKLAGMTRLKLVKGVGGRLLHVAKADA